MDSRTTGQYTTTSNHYTTGNLHQVSGNVHHVSSISQVPSAAEFAASRRVASHHDFADATRRTQQTGEPQFVDTRRVESKIVSRQPLNMPAPVVRTAQGPDQIIPQKKVVDRPETREQPRHETKIETRFIDKVVEVPQIETREEIVHVNKVIKQRREIPQTQIVEKPVERIVTQTVHRHVPVQSERQVYTETLVTPVTEVVTVPVAVGQIVDKQQAVLVAQTVKPVIVEGHSAVDVEVTEYEAEVVHVDIQVAKFVEHQLVQYGEGQVQHRVVAVPSQQYNSLLRYLNTHLSESELRYLPYSLEHGQVRFLDVEQRWQILPANVTLLGHTAGAIYTNGVIQTADLHSESQREIRAVQARLDSEYRAQLQQIELRNQEARRRLEMANQHAREACQREMARIQSMNAMEASKTTSHTSHMLTTSQPQYNYGPMTTTHNGARVASSHRVSHLLPVAHSNSVLRTTHA